MNPYPYPRDILSPNVSPKQTKIRSFIRFLGAIAARKPCAVVAGGFMVVGSIHMLRKGRQWFCTRRSSASRKKRDVAPRVDAGTQTDPCEQCSISEHDSLLLLDTKNRPETSSNQATGSTCTGISAMNAVLSSHPSQSGISETSFIEEVHSNAWTKRDTPDICVACACHYRTNKREQQRIPEMTQSPHPVCQLSIVMALLALHKVSSCEKNNSCKKYQGQQTVCKTGERKRVGDKRLLKPRIKPVTSLKRKPSDFSFIDKSGFNDSDQAQNASEQNQCSKEPFQSLSLDATGRSAPSELDTNPFEIQTFDTSKHSNSPKVEDKPVFNESELSSGVRPPFSEREARINQASHTHNGETPVVARKPHGGRKKFDWSRSEHTEESGKRQRGKPKRRGSRRKNNVPPREYVDLDNPQQVASQHHFRSNV